MTLSQIIAKDSFFDRRISVEGQWKIFVLVKSGNVVNVKIEENIKKEKEKVEV